MKTSISRYRASGTHFFLSCMVGLGLLMMCWYMWYPTPMLRAIGGYEIFFLIVGIDVVLGPALTLVVFKPGKKGLVFDLAVIAVVQVSAFLYGVSTLLEARPAYIAALGKEFQVVQASEITDGSLAKGKTTLPIWGPKLVGTKEPTDPADISNVNAMMSFGGNKGHLTQLHIPYADMKDEILKNAEDFTVLEKNNEDKKADIQSWLKSNDCDEKTCKYQPIKIRASVFPAVLDAKTAAYKGIMPLALKM
ncbi:hypothetical protein ACO0LL_26295 [Undibacterium sp. TC4M20W]|uniref:hypothetical protein n=1 Tax=unclassified Undibacterium TaxID=2630295 RepID=UPI003BEFFB07